MADGGLCLIDVIIKPCKLWKYVINCLWTQLCSGTNDGHGKVVHGFKVGSLRYSEITIIGSDA